MVPTKHRIVPRATDEQALSEPLRLNRCQRPRVLMSRLLQRLSCLQMPVFVTSGDSDPMILPQYSYLLAGPIPQARAKIYPDSAHGFLFQHHAEFARDADELLAGPT